VTPLSTALVMKYYMQYGRDELGLWWLPIVLHSFRQEYDTVSKNLKFPAQN